jgi:hypothetical protein
LRPEGSEHLCGIVSSDIDADQGEPRPLECSAAEVGGMLQRVRGEDKSVPASPRFLMRMVQREELFESSTAGSKCPERAGATLRTGFTH